MRAWQKGCKGFTVYRDGCRTGVLVRKDDKNDSSSRSEMLADNHAPKRVEVLDCNIHQVRVKGEAWTILMGLMNGRPYELFGGLSSTIEIPKSFRMERF